MTGDRVLARTPDDEFRVERACREDLAQLLAVQHEAFGRVAQEAGVPLDHMPPARESLGELEQLYDGGMAFFVARDTSDSIVGTVRGALVDHSVEVGRLGVTATALRRGVARALMRALEDAFPSAERFELFTGADAAGPIALYESLGYSIFATETMGPWTLVRMERRRP